MFCFCAKVLFMNEFARCEGIDPCGSKGGKSILINIQC